MTGHRALEKKQITQGNNRKVQNPSGSPRKSSSYHEDNCLILYYTLRSQFIYINLPC